MQFLLYLYRINVQSHSFKVLNILNVCFLCVIGMSKHTLFWVSDANDFVVYLLEYSGDFVKALKWANL